MGVNLFELMRILFEFSFYIKNCTNGWNVGLIWEVHITMCLKDTPSDENTLSECGSVGLSYEIISVIIIGHLSKIAMDCRPRVTFVQSNNNCVRWMDRVDLMEALRSEELFAELTCREIERIQFVFSFYLLILANAITTYLAMKLT